MKFGLYVSAEVPPPGSGDGASQRAGNERAARAKAAPPDDPDVPDLRRVLPEACELVEEGVMSDADFRVFACGNAMRMLTAANPRFFEGTAVADAARKLAHAAA